MNFPFEDLKGPGLLPRTSYIMWRQRKESKMITERTLRKWRKEALSFTVDPSFYDETELKGIAKAYIGTRERILQMTQELLDQHLLRK